MSQENSEGILKTSVTWADFESKLRWLYCCTTVDQKKEREQMRTGYRSTPRCKQVRTRYWRREGWRTCVPFIDYL